MELANCKCKSVGDTCSGYEPCEGFEGFESIIKSYDDYLNNKRFIENKQKEYSEKYGKYQKLHKDNLRMLKNLFLSDFIDSEKQIKGLCIHETKFKKDPFRQRYLYIIGTNKQSIFEEGIYVSAIRIQFHETDGCLTDIALYKEESCYVDYETLCSCQITEKEFMDTYNRVHFKIIENLGLNKE